MRYFKNQRRRKIRTEPFPPEWHDILEKRVSLYGRLPAADRSELHGHVLVFLDEKSFEGCGGLAVTDEIRVIIAAQACVLLLHRDSDYYPALSSILVYPAAYTAPAVEYDGDIVTEYDIERTGETWQHGSLVLSWNDVLSAVGPAPRPDGDEHKGHRGGNGGGPHGAGTPPGAASGEPVTGPDAERVELVPAYNVVLHEFAHQLDLENGELDGAPMLPSREQYEQWLDVLERGAKQLEAELRDGVEPVIDEYALEDPAEFFAVATESFFETPIALYEEYPDVYDALMAYYEQDPAGWGET